MEQNLRVEGKSTAEPKTMHIGRNAEIDFMRIFMAFVIMMHHSNKMRPPDPERSPFIGGYLAVEFFFMLSGYFAVERTIKSNNLSYRNALLWTLKKYTKFFPYVFLAVMIGYGVNAYIAQMTLYDTLKAFTYSIFEILLLPMSGMYETLIVGQLWYLSALLIVLPLFYAALVKNEEFFLYIGCPLSAVLIYGCYSVTASHIDQWSGWLGFCYQALPRAWAGICLGGVVYLMKETIIKYENTLSNVGKHLLSILEAASLVFVILWNH